MKIKQLNNIFYVGLISICTANTLFAETKKSDITYDVIDTKESAYENVNGYIATKSSTGSKMDIDINEIPQSVSVITSDMMETRAVDSIVNVTSYDASVNNTYGEEDARTNYSSLRGAGGSLYNSTFLDGLLLLNSYGAIPKIDPYAAQRVEILKGPSSTLYGASGPGGLLNIQSKKASSSKKKEIGVSYGSHSTKAGFFDINDEFSENLQFRLTGKLKKGGLSLKTSQLNSYFLNPALKYVINDDTTLDILTSFAKNDVKRTGLSFGAAPVKLNYHNSFATNAANAKDYLNYIIPSFAGIPTSMYQAALEKSAKQVNAMNLSNNMYIGAGDNEVANKSHRSVSTIFNKNFNENAMFKSAMRYMTVDSKSDYSYYSLQGLVQTLATMDFTKVPLELTGVRNDLKSFAIDNNFEYKYSKNSIDNTTLVGLDLQYMNANQKRYEAVPYFFDLNNPNANLDIQVSDNKTVNNNTKFTQLGVYAQNHLKLDDKYVISTSLRYDKVDNKNKDKLKNKETSQKDNNLSGRIGFTYLANNGLAPYVSYSTSFKPNVGSDKNNNQFKPSIGEQIEVGVKYRPQNFDALFSLAAYHLENKDILTEDPSNIAYNVQEADAQVKGLEFNILTKPTENTNVTFSLAKLDGKQKNKVNKDLDGKDISDTAELNAALWTDYTFENTSVGDINIGAGVKYIGKSKYYRTDYSNLKTPYVNGYPTFKTKAFDVDDYALVDARIGTKYKDLDLSLNVYNVFDKQAEIAINSLSSNVRDGRTFKVTASYKF